MKMIRVFSAAALALVCLVSQTANAALIGVTQTFPDVTLNQDFIIYDHNGINATTGVLRIASLASTLNRASGVSTPAQSYLATGDTTADVMLSVQINNTTGAFQSGTVSIGFGNNAANPRFSWQGTINAFGFLDNGSQFDARWTLNSDQYQNMPAGFTTFVNGLFSGKNGVFSINNSYGFGAGNNWMNSIGRDWVFGTGVTSTTAPASITPLLTGLDAAASRIQAASTVQADVSVVPIPGALWLMISGLGALCPFVRRSNKNSA